MTMITRAAITLCTILLPGSQSIFGTDSDAPDKVLATYLIGEVTQAELENVSAVLPASSLPRPKSKRLQAIAIMEYLDETGDIDDSDPALQVKIRSARAKTLVPLFTRELTKSCEISEEELEKRFRENRENFLKPEKRRLRHIFKRSDSPNPGEDGKVSEEMESIRQKLIDGADFESIAREESESKTRFDGGLVGSVIRGQMPGELEETVFSLEEKEISPVVEYNNGYHLFRCESITVQRTPTEEEIRKRIRNFYRQNTFRARWGDLQEQWVAEAKIDIGAVQSDDEEVALQIADGSSFSGAEISTFLAAADRQEIDDARLRKILRQLIVDSRAALEYLEDHEVPGEILAAQEIRVRKIRSDHAFALRLESAGKLIPPTDAELRALYEANKEDLIQDREFRVETVIVRLEPATMVEDTESLERLHALLSKDRTLDFVTTARDQLSPSVLERSQISEPTWRTKVGIRSGGGASIEALDNLEPGEISPIFRTSFGNPTLRIMRLHEIREPRPLTFEESRPGLEDFLIERQKEARRNEVEQALLEEMDYRPAD